MPGDERIAAGAGRASPRLVRRASGRVLLWGSLAAYIGALYLAVVVGIGSALGTTIPNTGLSVLAITIVALTFGRVRTRAQRFADRLVRGQHASPEEVLERFAEQLAETADPDEALARMTEIVAEGVGAVRAEVWLAARGELFSAASWPPSLQGRRPRVALPPDGLPVLPRADRAAPVRYGGELLGAITVGVRPGDPVSAVAATLLDDLASQAGLVLRTVRLAAELAARLDELKTTAAELRASRRRIVDAQDAERRRLERDIHDGAQQHLVALAVKVRMARTLAERDPGRTREAIVDLRALTGSALENLRDLTRGIYPPVLAAEGLEAALRAHAERSGMRISVSSRGVSRLDPVIEAAVYFSCLEAIQNAAKHANAGEVRVAIESDRIEVAFTISDDGVGFDPARVSRGSGLNNMDDRLSVLGGRIAIASEPGRGTTVTGRLPLRAPDALASAS